MSDGESAKKSASIDLQGLQINFSRVGKSEDMDSKKKDWLSFTAGQAHSRRSVKEMAAYYINISISIESGKDLFKKIFLKTLDF